jgi:hypothetical protein
LAPTVGIAATGFCHLGGILQLFHRRYQQIFSTSSRSTSFTAAHNRSKQIDSTEFIINISYRLHRQDLQHFVVKNHQVPPNQRITGWMSRENQSAGAACYLARAKETRSYTRQRFQIFSASIRN